MLGKFGDIIEIEKVTVKVTQKVTVKKGKILGAIYENPRKFTHE